MAKIGEGQLAGMARQGLKELAQYLPAFNTGQHIQEDPTLVGNVTSREAYEQKNPDMEAMKEQLAEKLEGKSVKPEREQSHEIER